MSQIIHRCTSCGKPDYWRDGKTAGATVNGAPLESGTARTCCRGRSWGPPELAPTFVLSQREPVAAVVKPGGPAGAVGATTCNCDDCVAFYEAVAR